MNKKTIIILSLVILAQAGLSFAVYKNYEQAQVNRSWIKHDFDDLYKLSKQVCALMAHHEREYRNSYKQIKEKLNCGSRIF